MVVGVETEDGRAFYYTRSVLNPAVIMQCYARLCLFHDGFHMLLYLKVQVLQWDEYMYLLSYLVRSQKLHM